MQKLKLKNDKSVGMAGWVVKVLRKEGKKWVAFTPYPCDTQKDVDTCLEDHEGTVDRRLYVYKLSYDFREGYQA